MHSKLEDVCLSFYDDVFSYIAFLTRDKELTKDLTQETFIKALKSLQSLKDPAKIKGWLFRIARNTCLTEIRKRKKVVFVELFEELADVQISTPEKLYLLREKEKWWEKLFAALSEEERRIFNLRVHERYSFDEIAEQLGIKAGAVRVKFHRLRIKLINLLEKKGEENEGL